MQKHSRRTECHGASPHAAAGVQPTMAEETYTYRNGKDNSMLPALRQLIGGVNKTWASLAAIGITIGSIAGPLIVSGFLSIPAKETDMREAKAAIAELQAEFKTLSVAVTRLEEGDKSQQRQLERIEGKMDRLLDLRLAPASPAQISPSEAERNRRRSEIRDNTIRAQ
jgi:hypothetical protein